MSRAGRGFFGAAIGLLAASLFFFGLTVRSCLPDHPELLLIVPVELVIVGFVVTVPSIVAGFLIGYFLGLKLQRFPANLLVPFTVAIAFGIGYATGVPHNSCFPL